MTEQSRRSLVEIDSLADVSAYTLRPDRLEQLLSERFECTFCWTNLAGEPVALTEAFIHDDGVFWLVSVENRVRTSRPRRRSPLV